MAKKIGIALLILIALVGGAFYYVYSNAGSLIKSAIETYGSEATKTAVRVSSVSLSLSAEKGAVTVKDLSVANPEGYSANDALKLGSVSVSIDPKSVAGTGPIVIREISIDHPAVSYEHNLTSGNLDVLRKNVASYSGQAASGGGSGTSAGPAQQSRKIIIDDLYVRDGTVTVSDPVLKEARLNAALPLIHLSNIGKAKGGATQAEVVQLVLGVIMNSAIQVGAGTLTQNLGTAGGALGKTAPGALKGLFGSH
jgi:hypothetical protein